MALRPVRPGPAGAADVTTCVASAAIVSRAAGPRLETLLLIPLVLGGMSDLPRVVGAGSMTGLGMLTLGQLALAGLGCLACGRYPRALLWRLLPFAALLAWMAIRSLVTPPAFAGSQNGVVYTLFGLQLLLAGTIAARTPDTIERVIDRGIRTADWIAWTLAAASLAVAGGDGEAWLIGQRSFALLAIVPVAWHLAAWQQGRRSGAIRAAIWCAAVLLSMSRTGTAVALLNGALVVLLQLRYSPGRLLRGTPVLLLGAAGLAVAAFLFAEPLRERFFGGYTTEVAGGLEVSTSGRDALWPVVIDSAMRSPIVGQGLGSSQEALTVFGDAAAHPHNDYLRVWHDLGLVGLACFVAGLLAMLVTLWRDWRRPAAATSPSRGLSLAGLLAVLAFALAAITDNAVIYGFVMAPLGVVAGAALGAGGPRRRAAGPQRFPR